MVAVSAVIPVALSAVRALIKYRSRVDAILSLDEAAAGLPLLLPPLPGNRADHQQDAIEFFGAVRRRGERGLDPESQRRLFLLEVHGLTEGCARICRIADGEEDGDLDRDLLDAVIDLFMEANDLRIDCSWLNRADGARVPSEKAVSYFVVRSARLSRNPAFARLLLATADSLLEFVGENASLVVSDPRMRGVVETVIAEFAGRADFDDAGVEEIFRRILGAAAVAAVAHRDLLPHDYPVSALVGALADLRADPAFGTDFVAGFVAGKGFETLLSRLLVRLGDDPWFAEGDDTLRKMTARVVAAVGAELPGGFDGGSGHRIVEAAVLVLSEDLRRRLDTRRLGEGDIAGVVLEAMLAEVRAQAQANALFAGIEGRTLFGDLYEAALRGIAGNAAALADGATRKAFVAELVRTLATSLADAGLDGLLTRTTLDRLLSESMLTAARYPEVIAGNSAFGAKLTAAALGAAAPLLRDGLTVDEAVEIVDRLAAAAAENPELADANDNWRLVLAGATAALSNDSVKSLLSPSGRKEAVVSFFRSMTANPLAWRKMADRDATILQPLVDGVIGGLAREGAPGGPVMVAAIGESFRAAMPRLQVFIDRKITEGKLRDVMEAVLAAAKEHAGAGLPDERVPGFVGRVLRGVLDASLAGVELDDAAVRDIIGTALAAAKGE